MSFVAPASSTARLAPSPRWPIAMAAFTGDLWSACEAALALVGARGEHIHLACAVHGLPPSCYRDALVRIARRLVLDACDTRGAVDAMGFIDAQLTVGPDQVVLTVRDDGWVRRPRMPHARHLRWATRITGSADGQLTRRQHWEATVTRVALPLPAFSPARSRRSPAG